MALVDDGAVVAAGLAARAHQVAGDVLDRFLRRRQPEPQQRLRRHALQPFERQRQVRPAPRPDHRVDFVDDHGPHALQHVAAAAAREQQVQRLGRRDENVRRPPEHRGAFGLRRVAGPHRDRDPRRLESCRFGRLPDAAPRLGQVLVNVGAQGLEWRHIHDAHFVGQRLLEPLAKQVVERVEERRQRLARPGGRGDQRVTPFADRGPPVRLRGSRLAKRVAEPGGNGRMEARERHFTRGQAPAITNG